MRQATLSAIENEQTRRVDFDVLERLARALDVDPGFLVGPASVAKVATEKREEIGAK